jgi:hypothetical protein
MIINSSYSIPILSEGRADYKSPHKYELSKSSNKCDNKYIEFLHSISQGNFICHLLKNGLAKFAISTSIKSSMNRQSLLTDDINISNDKIIANQQIFLEDTAEIQNFIGYIVYTGDDKIFTLNSKDMSLDDFWDNVSISMPKGTILAKSPWLEQEKNLANLISVEKAYDIKFGFKVLVDPNNGGKFKVKMKPELFDQLNRTSNDNIYKNNIISHILASGFYELRNYRENGELTNFEKFRIELKENGFKTWEDEDFYPNEIADFYVKIKIPGCELGDEND